MARWILKTKQKKVTLTGSTTYDKVNDPDSDPVAYQRICFTNQTGSDLKIKVNGATDYGVIEDNGSYDSGEAKQETPWQDTITANGTGSLTVFIAYWDYV